MIILNKNNFTISTLQKHSNSLSTPKSTFHADFKICIVLEGQAIWEIEDRSYSVEPGDVVFLNVGQKRSFTSYGKNGFKLCIFTLSRNAFSQLHHFMFFLKRVKNQENMFKKTPLSILLKEIYDERQLNSSFSYELASAKLTEFFVKAERAEGYSFDAATQNDRDILELMDYIDANITNGINLCSVAQKAMMTESTFSRHFSALNGVSFKHYIVEKRIQHAIKLLKTTDLKMVDIALESGFDSVSGFYAAFRQKTGTTPNKYFE